MKNSFAAMEAVGEAQRFVPMLASKASAAALSVANRAECERVMRGDLLPG